MNKEITVIDLFKRIEKHEDIPKKIKYKDSCYIFKHTNYSIDHLYGLIGHENIGWLDNKDINLFDEVEILDDNIEEIEELNAYKLMESPYMANLLKEQRYDKFMELLKQSEVEIADKLIKLTWVVKEIRKEQINEY